jgi:hypothetical protein
MGKYFAETIKAADDLTNALGSINGPNIPAIKDAAAKLSRYWLAGEKHAGDVLKLFSRDMENLGITGYVMKMIRDSIGREA